MGCMLLFQNHLHFRVETILNPKNTVVCRNL